MSVLLATIEALHYIDIVALAQLPGKVVGAEIGATDAAFDITKVLVNATCYTVVFAGLLVLVRMAQKPTCNQ